MELNRFNIAGTLRIQFEGGDDDLRITSSDSGKDKAVHTRFNRIGQDSIVINEGGYLVARIEDVHIDGHCRIVNRGQGSRIALTSRRIGNDRTPMTVGGELGLFTSDSSDSITLDGVQQWDDQFLIGMFDGIDRLSIEDSEFSMIVADLGPGEDTLSIRRSTCKTRIQLHGGEGTEDTGNIVKSRFSSINFDGFEAGNLSQ